MNTAIATTTSNAGARNEPTHSARKGATSSISPRRTGSTGVGNGRHRSHRSTQRKHIKWAIEHFENLMHYLVAAVLIAIATTMMAETVWTLMTSSTTFAVAASGAVGGVLFVLILVEITRTVVFPPDSRGVAIRRLFTIAIVSALREVLLISAHSMMHPVPSHDELTGIPLEMGISTAVVVGMAAAFVLVHRASEKSS